MPPAHARGQKGPAGRGSDCCGYLMQRGRRKGRRTRLTVRETRSPEAKLPRSVLRGKAGAPGWVRRRDPQPRGKAPAVCAELQAQALFVKRHPNGLRETSMCFETTIFSL